jgi:hypothetical protein
MPDELSLIPRLQRTIHAKEEGCKYLATLIKNCFPTVDVGLIKNGRDVVE